VSRVDVLFVTSSGGHLSEVLEWLPAFSGLEWVVVLNAPGEVPEDVRPRVVRVAHAERDARVLWNLVEAWRLLRRLRPGVVVSPGAGCAVPFAVAARLLAIPTIHVEPRSAVSRPTLTGRLVRPFVRRMIVQWPALKKAFPRARLRDVFAASSSSRGRATSPSTG
jgi:UDP-N-acetylglucosamine:LPS N-acetylglucosamine transferase